MRNRSLHHITSALDHSITMALFNQNIAAETLPETAGALFLICHLTKFFQFFVCSWFIAIQCNGIHWIIFYHSFQTTQALSKKHVLSLFYIIWLNSFSILDSLKYSISGFLNNVSVQKVCTFFILYLLTKCSQFSSFLSLFWELQRSLAASLQPLLSYLHFAFATSLFLLHILIAFWFSEINCLLFH